MKISVANTVLGSISERVDRSKSAECASSGHDFSRAVEAQQRSGLLAVPLPALKRMIKIEVLSRSAEALLPPHKCGGSHLPGSIDESGFDRFLNAIFVMLENKHFLQVSAVPVRQAQGRLCGTGPSLESLPRTASWATLSRPFGTKSMNGGLSHTLFRPLCPFSLIFRKVMEKKACLRA